MKYNTQRDTLVMPEYGRGVQDMVELAITIPDREKRQACANAIVAVMARLQPEPAGQEDYRQKLWNHLARIAHYRLDIDYPVEILPEEEAAEHPAPLHYPMKRIAQKHYGALVESSLRYAASLPEGPERETLVQMVANQMKQDLFVWNRDAMNETLVAEDIERYTRGEVKLNLDDFRFAPVGMPSASQLAGVKKKKRKA
ncbi:MAG: DUF4290 domain-containing protein [Bacteroidaceae bacterium]|nr:DUF4290 domain-containing protein [Bacteroidaceae bacterium]